MSNVKRHHISFRVEEAPADPFEPDNGVKKFRLVRACAGNVAVYGVFDRLQDAIDCFDRMNASAITRAEVQMLEGELRRLIENTDRRIEAVRLTVNEHAAQRKH